MAAPLGAGRGGGIRTPTRGFGDRWSAVKPTPLRDHFSVASELLDLLVRMMLAAERAELAQFQPLRGSFLVLGRGVIAILALRALKSNDLARHLIAPLDSVSTRAGRTCPKPTARPVWNAPEQLTVRKAGAVDQD